MDLKGLNSEQVRDRILKGLQNKSTKTKSKKVREILFENIFSLFNLIIFSIILFLLIFYFQSDDRRLILDSIGIFSIAIINTLIAIIQEIRAKRALDKVNLLLKKEVTVIRDAKQFSIDQTNVVVDDLIVIGRGDQVVVDGKVISSNHLEIDESLLTGESLSILKLPEDTVLSGSFCISGSGIYIAEKVGDLCYASEITKLAKKYKFNLSPLQIKINFIVKSLFVSAVVLVILEILFQHGNFTDIDFIRKISTILISLVPQGLVLMSSVTFALGIYRISRIGAIIQKLNAIESFSNVKIVCTDKTGTLTKNKLSVYKLSLLHEKYSLDETKIILGTYFKYSSDKNATLRTLEKYPSHEYAEKVDEIPFSSEYKRSLLELKINNEKIKIVFGGLDVLLESINPRIQNVILDIIEKNGLNLYRNLLFGLETSNKTIDELRENINKLNIEPICIISISDEIRDDVLDAINLFQEKDIKVKILSGDAAQSIQAVANEIGWDISDRELISGDEIDNIADNDLKNIILSKSVFARLKPEHKLRIIRSLKKEKIYTAMIGDGVNDLPAIKESDLGIAMEEGSKITKEVADIVLLKNKFALLPQIFEEGNKIVNTVNSVSKLFLTKNFMVIYLSLISLLFLFEFPLTPRRVSLINIFSIGLPAFVIALKNVNAEKMKYFMEDLISFVCVSSFIIIGATYFGQYYTQKFFNINEKDLQMVMMSIMIITTISNFLSIALRKGEKNILIYLIYAASILSLYLFLALTQVDFIIFRVIKHFYEITSLEYRYWGVVGIISIVSSLLLFVLQKLREKILLKYQ